MSDALACGPISAGLYVDDAPRLATTADFVERIIDIGYDHVCVMVDGPGNALHNVRWTLEQLETFRELLLASHAPRDVESVLTLWGEPTRTFVEQVRVRLPGMLRALGTLRVELDLEGGWSAKALQGFARLDDAATALIDVIRGAGAKLEVVSWRARLRAIAAFLPHIERLTLMIYPRRHRSAKEGGLIGSNHPTLGPRTMVERELRLVRTRILPAQLELAAALPAWDQSWPSLTPAQAMRLERAQALDEGVKVIRSWSSKWLVGARRQSVYAVALAELLKTPGSTLRAYKRPRIA